MRQTIGTSTTKDLRLITTLLNEATQVFAMVGRRGTVLKGLVFVNQNEQYVAKAGDELSLRSVQVLFLPCHLDGFQLAFIRLLRIVIELSEFHHVAMQVRKADSQGIHVRMLFRKQNS